MGEVIVVETVIVTTEIVEIFSVAAEIGAALGPVGIAAAVCGVGAVVCGVALVKQLMNSGGSKNDENHKKKQENQNETTKRAKTTDSGRKSEKSNASASSGSADDPNDRNNRGNGKKSNDQKDTDLSEDSDSSDEYDFISTESVEIIVSSDSNESKEHKKRNIRYKNPEGRSHRFKSIRKHFKGQGTRFEIDHAPSIAIMKKLLIKIKSFNENRIPNHLKRVVKMLKIFFKTNNLQTLYGDINNLREKYGSILFAILVIKSVHRAQESTGNSRRQEAYTDEVVDLFIQGNIPEAFKRIFKDYFETIMVQINTLDKESVETQFDWIKNFINYLFRRQIITENERDNLIAYIKEKEIIVLKHF